MSKHRKRWTATEKLEVINYFEKWGPTKASREYNVSAASIYKWKAVHEKNGKEGLNKKPKRSPEAEEVKRLKRENDELKKIVAEKELRLRIQAEMLKKSH